MSVGADRDRLVGRSRPARIFTKRSLDWQAKRRHDDHDPRGCPIAYEGQHDDCIATVPHFHDNPYQLGDWGSEPTHEKEPTP